MIIRAFHSRLNRAFLVGCVLVGAIATKAEAGYTFTFVADSTGPFSDFGVVPSPALNALGTVAFVARFEGSGAGVFTGNGGALTTITTIATPPFGNPFSPPSINDSGMVAVPAGDRILAGNGGPLVTIADTAGQFKNFVSGYSASINSGGTVAFTASLDSGGGGYFASTGGIVTPLFLSSLSLGTSFSFAMNDAGTLGFRATKPDNITGIVTLNGGSVTTIVDSTGPFNYFGSAPSLNGVGRVAFAAGVNGRDGGVFGIYSGNGGALTTIADLAGPFSYLGDFDTYLPSINASGMVAFSAGLDAGGGGVFIGNGTITSEVIQAGDPLFGSTVLGAGVFPRSLNDAGQVAFYYELANGTTGIAIANPIPEPGSAALLFGGLLAIFSSRRRRALRCGAVRRSLSPRKTRRGGQPRYAFL